MNHPNHISGLAGPVLCAVIAAGLASCTTYVEERPPRAAYAPPPPVEVTPAPPPVVVAPAEAPVVVIQAESDFYEPLTPYGTWVVVGSYGRCWRPAQVDTSWRPYCIGHWQRTDAGWYWASDEPWGWATYHYGRWDWSAEFGWFWVPHVQWAPAWVSWRQGAGYVGWAPLPPSALIGARGILEVRETPTPARGFVFVSEQRLLEPVRPTTVIVNNTTIINQTVNITKVQVVNKTVINEGPQPQVIERKSGRRIEAVPVRELRRREETEVAAKERNIPTRSGKTDQRPAVAESAPARTIPGRDPNRSEQPAAVPSRVQPRQGQNETRSAGAPPPARGTVPSVRPPGPMNRPQSPAVVNPSETPARPVLGQQMGHERQRTLQPGNAKNEAPNPAKVAKPGQPSANRPAIKPKTSGKPPVKGRGAPVSGKKGDQKKDSEKETPETTVSPRQPK